MERSFNLANLLGAIGQARPVSDFVGTAMQYGQYQQNSALRGMQAQREQLALDEAKKQAEHLETIVDFKLTPFYLALPESARPQAEQMFKGLGAFDENYRGTRRQMYAAVGEIEKSAPALKALMQPVIDARGQGVAKAFEAYRRNPTDPKSREVYEQAQMEYAAVNGKILDHIKLLEAQDAATFHNVPEGGTGIFVNKRGEQVGEPILGAPKERNADPFTAWSNSFTETHGREPNAAEIMGWHRAGKATTGEGPAKIGALGMVNRELAGRYLPFAKMNLEGKGDVKTYENVLAMLTTTDQFGGTVNDARLREALLPHQRDAYDAIKTKAQNYARTMNPAEAVDKAIADWWKGHPAGTKTASPPSGYTDTGRFHEGKRLYHNPNAQKGREYWTAE